MEGCRLGCRWICSGEVYALAATGYSVYMPNHRRIEGDCLDVMRELPRGHYDLLLTDPPYAMPATYYNNPWSSTDKAHRRWSDTSIMTGWFRLFMQRVAPLLKSNAMTAVFANGPAVAAFWPIMHELTQGMQLVVWDKQKIGTGTPFMKTCEFIVVGWTGTPYKSPNGLHSVLSYAIVQPKKRQHPAQKPRDLLMALARHLCPEGGRVLDPFAFSHSTEAACESLGLECTSIEWGEAFAMPDEQEELFESRAAALPAGTFVARCSPWTDGPVRLRLEPGVDPPGASLEERS